MNVYQLNAQEIYETFAPGIDPADLLDQSRIDLATRLRVEEGLKQEDAYYATDQMLAYARQVVEGQNTQPQ